MVPAAVLARRRRNSNRRPGYDYSSPGAYFVTTCTNRRELLLEDAYFARAVRDLWWALPHYYDHVQLDNFVVMPNHFHGLIWLDFDLDLRTSVGAGVTLHSNQQFHSGVTPAPTVAQMRTGIPEIVRTFKTSSARRINALRKTKGASVWQRGFHDRIIRCDAHLDRVRDYILNNPARWEFDPENPNGHPDTHEETFWQEILGRPLVVPQ